MAHGITLKMMAITTKEQRILDRYREEVLKQTGGARPGTSKGFYDLGRFPKKSQAKLRRIERQTGIR